MLLPVTVITTLPSRSAKKTDSLVETGETELYGHGESLLRERLQRAEEVRFLGVKVPLN